jgi:hypothetical protein
MILKKKNFYYKIDFIFVDCTVYTMKEITLLQQVLDTNDRLKTQIKDLEDILSQHKEYHHLHNVKIEKLQFLLFMFSIIIILRIGYGLNF